MEFDYFLRWLGVYAVLFLEIYDQSSSPENPFQLSVIIVVYRYDYAFEHEN